MEKQKRAEEQYRLEEQRRVEKERLEEIKRREQDRILQVIIKHSVWVITQFTTELMYANSSGIVPVETLHTGYH